MDLHQKITSNLNRFQSLDLKPQFSKYACVAAILRGTDFSNLEVGYIQRAFHESDRWSGQMAFPGGKKELTDIDDVATAIRETSEEIGIHLKPEECVGRLDDVQARKAGTVLSFFIRPYVFYIDREVTLKLDANEVADFFWIPLSYLQDANNKTQHSVIHENIKYNSPAVRLHRDPVLWGLTLMMTEGLLKRVLP